MTSEPFRKMFAAVNLKAAGALCKHECLDASASLMRRRALAWLAGWNHSTTTIPYSNRELRAVIALADAWLELQAESDNLIPFPNIGGRNGHNS